jgi:hypothetical protein
MRATSSGYQQSSTLVVIRSIPFRQTVGLAVRIFTATTRTFAKDTALSANDRGAEWHLCINAARHGNGMGAEWARHDMRELSFIPQ